MCSLKKETESVYVCMCICVFCFLIHQNDVLNIYIKDDMRLASMEFEMIRIEWNQVFPQR